MIMWIPRFIYLIMVLIVSFGLIFAFTATKVNVGDIESHILMHRLHFSPYSISKVDENIGRVYTGVVDETKFNGDTLEDLLNASTNSFAMRLTKRDLEVDSDETNIFLHETTYSNWQPIASLVDQNQLTKGSGLKFPYKEARYVYSENPSSGNPSILEIVVIMPNE